MEGNGIINTARHIKVYGRVQGVGFRYSARTIAHKIGVTGWVRNEYDGTVEVVCEGPAEAVKRFVKWLAKGPLGAHVSRIEEKKVPYSGAYRSFTVEF